MPISEALGLLGLATMGAFVQSVSGFGFSLFIVPPLAILLGPRDAVVVSNALALFNNGYLAATTRGHIEWRLWTVLIVSAAAGMPVGLLVLEAVNPDTMKIAIAVVVIISTLLIWKGFRLQRSNLLLDTTTGFVSGILNTTTSMNGPPVVLYMQGRGMAPSPFRSTIAAYFFMSGIIAVTIFAIGGRVDGGTFAQVGVALPGILAGWYLGNRVFQRLPAERFRTIVIVVLLLSAGIALTTATL
jgi:uncharacterized membrane protein YfcA